MKKTAEEKKKTTKKRRRKRPPLLLFIIEILLALLMISLLMKSVTINDKDKIKFADEGVTDKISCGEGKLIVNNVSASVPTKGKPEYDISYSWAETDTEYPTIPRAVIASYRDKEGNLLYEISLYRDSFTPKEDIPEGKTPVNWFDDWKTGETEGSRMNNETVAAGEFRGFLVSPPEDSQGMSTKAPRTLYFAVSGSKGLSVYVLEGILYDEESKDVFLKAMDASTRSLKKTDRTAKASGSGDDQS